MKIDVSNFTVDDSREFDMSLTSEELDINPPDMEVMVKLAKQILRDVNYEDIKELYPRVPESYIDSICNYFIGMFNHNNESDDFRECVNISVEHSLRVEDLKLLEIVWDEELDSVTRDGISIINNGTQVKIIKQRTESILSAKEWDQIGLAFRQKRIEENEDLFDKYDDGFEGDLPSITPDIGPVTTETVRYTVPDENVNYYGQREESNCLDIY